ncbi:hypothetical protein AHF37_03541 [Paragonimus kellicotti]|nr:hypothetical protein AHF37_03541 [Paragonimus kellicotti]
MAAEDGSALFSSYGFDNPNFVKLKRFCRKGIPPDQRAEIWLEISGAMERLQTYPGLYRSLLSQQPPQKLLNVILADVPRTYPENVHFRNPDDSDSKLHSLERVLKAFAVKFPHIGYCQGFNYITAILLLVLHGRPEEVEEQAFWLLDALVNGILPSYYSDDMVSVRRDCMVLGELLRFTRFHSELVRFPSDSHFVQTTLRIFDCLFYEGDKILFRAGLALIRLHRDQLLECNEFPVLITAFRNMCRDKQTLWCHEFLQALFSLSGSLSRSKISKLRVQCESRVHEDR